MISFPLIARELRVQSRKRATYDGRVVWGSVAIALLAFFTWNFPNESANGRYVFSTIHACLAIMLFLVAPLGAADSLCREKREGTLGLLMLTQLTPVQVVLGKLAAHAVRLFYFALLMLPFLIIPVLLGGVESRDFLLSWGIALAISLAGLSAGLLASSIFLQFGVALSWAMILSVLLTLVVSSVAANLVFLLFPHNIPGDIPLAIRLFGLGPGLLLLPLQAKDVAAMFFPSRWTAFPFLTFGLPLLALSTLWFSIRFGARKVALHAEFAGETKRQAAFRRQFLTPVFWRRSFRRSMSRRLDGNPFIWLEYRTAWARAARWGMTLGAVAAETWILIQSPSRIEVLGMHSLLLFVLVLVLTFKSASSFQREKESGAFELLLVTPLTETRLVNGRLRAVASYYAPPLLLITFFALYALVWAQPSNYQEGNLSLAANITSICASLFSVPACGLYFALRCRTFLPALLGTAGLAILAPLCLWSAFQGLLWMGVRNQLGVALLLEDALRNFWWPVLIVLASYHLLLTLLFWRAAVRLLRSRNFRFGS